MATTVKNTTNGAKRNAFGTSGIRYVGLVTAFVGLVILLLGRNITSTVLQISSILLLLVGLLLTVSNIKNLVKKISTKEAGFYLLLGILFLVAGFLLYKFGGTIAKWIDIIIGVLLALYGLIMFINVLIHRPRNKALLIIDIILYLLLLATGVMVALMYVFGGALYIQIVGIIATVTGVSLVIMH